MGWKAATIEEVKQIVQNDLATCNRQQTVAFETYRVEPRLAPILRSGKLESVVAVAHKQNQVIYWEGVDKGFGVSSIGADGQLLEPDSNQNDLGLALNPWIE
jgi:hypothetical protein